MAIFSNKTILITGGAASIGADIVREFHAQGATLIIADINDTKGNELCSELKDRVYFLKTDITDDVALDNLVQFAIQKTGQINVLINNACSYGDDGSATNRATWLQTLNVSVVSAALLSEKCRPHLKKSKGCIVNTGSVSGNFPHIARWAYPVAKSALAHLSKTMAVEYAQDGIRVNLIRLGHVWSDPFRGLTQNNRPHADKSVSPFNLMGRVADGSEIGKTACFVASDHASYITGAEIPVDGGYSAMGPEAHIPLMPILMNTNQ